MNALRLGAGNLLVTLLPLAFEHGVRERKEAYFFRRSNIRYIILDLLYQMEGVRNWAQ